MIFDDALCPICQQPMKDDPVTCTDGHTYDRACITRWFNLGHRTSPKTNVRLTNLKLTPNITLRNMIQANLEAMPEELRNPQELMDSTAVRPLHNGSVDATWETWSYTVAFKNGPVQNREFPLDDIDANVTAAVVREIIAELLSNVIDNEGLSGVISKDSLVSRLRLKINDVEVHYQSIIPSDTHLEVEIVEDDCMSIIRRWRNEEMREKFISMGDLQHPDYDDLLWKQTPEFNEMVRHANTLQTGTQTRSAAVGPESNVCSEIVQVLDDAIQHLGVAASPEGVLQYLKEEL